ncbi:hypothetical protein D0504_04410 [Weissella confusa]|uniref:hypothetical protein n=1 Tax=Weissella confusa TaxID=1583 RepID=UPI0021C01E69|nr:hypothetical protein [Weissella confusa]MCT8392980.1 hypothetical protein [Weissella confusa]
MGKKRKRTSRIFNRPLSKPNPAKNVNQFFISNSAPSFDFPFNLLTWISVGEHLASGNRVMAGNVPGMLKIKAVFPKYANYLMDSVGIYDADSFKQHLEAWKKAQKHPTGIKQDDKTNDTENTKSTLDSINVAEPPVKIKHKMKIVATTGAAGVISGQKPQPVGKSKKASSQQQEKTEKLVKKSGKSKPKKKTDLNKPKKQVTSTPERKSTVDQQSSTNRYSHVHYTRISARERDNLFYADNSYDNY